MSIILSGCVLIDKDGSLVLLKRRDHGHFETPGGKVEAAECKNALEPTLDELEKTARREVAEEVGEGVKLSRFVYLGKVEFTIPDGRSALAHKFLARIIAGVPYVKEPNTFLTCEHIPLAHIEQYPLSPDLPMFLPKIRELLSSLLG